MDKIKEKVSNWLTYFKDHIQSFNVITQEKNYVYFSKFTLESEEFYQIHHFVATLKFNIVRDLLDQFKYCVYHIISFADKTLSERDKIMTIYSALYLNYFKKFLYDTTNIFEDFYDNKFSCLIKEFNIEIKDLKSFQVLCFCFYNKMKEQIIKLNYETKIKPLKHNYNAKINNNKFDEEIKNKFFTNDNNNTQANQKNDNNIINEINAEGLGVKKKAINYVVSAKEKIVDIIYEIKYKNFLPEFFSSKDEVNNINNTLSQLSNISAQNFEKLTKILEKEKLKSDEYMDIDDINMSLNDDITCSGFNESLNNSSNLSMNQSSSNKINEISMTDTFKNNMDLISNLNRKSINSNDINSFNANNKNNSNDNNNNINKINFNNNNSNMPNQSNINEIKTNTPQFSNINNNNLNKNNQGKIFKPHIIINTPQNKDNMYSHRLIDELIKNKIDDKTMENIIKMAKKIDENYLDFFLNNFHKPILILDYFACHVAHFTPKILQDIDQDIAKNLGNVHIKFIILAKELYNATMELFCSIYDLTSTNLNRFNRFIELAKICGIHVQYAQGLYKLFKDYSIMLLEGNAFQNLRNTVEKFIEMEKLNWEKVIQTSNISAF